MDSSDASPDGEDNHGHSWESLLALEADIAERMKDYMLWSSFMTAVWSLTLLPSMSVSLVRETLLMTTSTPTMDDDSDSEPHAPVTDVNDPYCDGNDLEYPTA